MMNEDECGAISAMNGREIPYDLTRAQTKMPWWEAGD
jgi:hypothetical protein